MFVCCGAIGIPCASAQRIWQVQGAEQPLPSPCSVGTIEKKKELVFFPIFNQKKKRKRFLHHSRLSSITINVNEKHPCNEPCMYMLSRFSRVRLFATLWTVARQAFLSIGFSRQEYWSGLPCPPSGDLPNPGIKSVSLIPPAVGRQVLYHERHLGSPVNHVVGIFNRG